MAFPRNLSLVVSAALMAGVTGCASSRAPEAESTVLRDRDARIEQLEREVSQREQRISSLNNQLATTAALPPVSHGPNGATAYNNIPGGDLLPPAKPGECYARVFIAPTFETRTEQVLKREASARVETIPAQYEKVTERVLVREASSKLVTVPATYEKVSERVLVQPARSYWTLGKGSKAGEADNSLVAEASKLGLNLAGAQPGSCYSERIVPAKFETRTEQVVASEASSRVEVIPAQYSMVDERVLVQEASTRIVEVPATYETISERVLVKPATTVWKKGTGPVTRVNDTTGEIMCLVEVPAEYKTVSKRVIKTPATTKTIDIPAKYETVKVRRMTTAPQERRIDIPAKYSTVSRREQVSDARRFWAPSGSGAEGKFTGRQLCMAETPAKYRTVTRQVVKTPAASKSVAIPAEYKTVNVTRLKTPASSRTIDIPAEYATVTKRVQVTDGQMAWREILCETNTTPGLVRKMQQALKNEGLNPGPIDGVVGGATLSAVRSYQQKKGLATGGVTMATLKSLGVL